VCVYERETERKRVSESERDRQSESVCVCVCVCVRACVFLLCVFVWYRLLVRAMSLM